MKFLNKLECFSPRKKLLFKYDDKFIDPVTDIKIMMKMKKVKFYEHLTYDMKIYIIKTIKGE